MNAFKSLAVIHDQAYENWKTFSHNLLTHVNPLHGWRLQRRPGTGVAQSDQRRQRGQLPELGAREIPDFRKAWNAWLIERYPDRAALAHEWGQLLHDDEDPEQGTVRLEGNIYGQEVHGRDVVCFLADVDRDFFQRTAKFLREELGVRRQVLLTNMNAWTNPVVTRQGCAAKWITSMITSTWIIRNSSSSRGDCPAGVRTRAPSLAVPLAVDTLRLLACLTDPSRSPNTTTPVPAAIAVSSGILTGAMGALQDWGAIWRFAYWSRPRGAVPARTHGLLQHGERSAESGGGTSEHLLVLTRRHAERSFRTARRLR